MKGTGAKNIHRVLVLSEAGDDLQRQRSWHYPLARSPFSAKTILHYSDRIHASPAYLS